MLYIHFNGQVPNESKFEYAIQGNNAVDVITFDISDIHLDFEPAHIYVKVQTKDKKYLDKIELANDGQGTLTWALLAKTTRHKIIQAQLSFETAEKCYQTEMVEITLKPYIDSDRPIVNDYPTVLQELQEQIDELKEQGGGGGSDNVIIERVWLTYDDKKSLVKDVIGAYDDKAFVNDSTRIWVNFKTNPISAKIEDEIKNGRFIIRLDYPIKKKSITRKLGRGNCLISHQPLTIQGVGARGFAPNFLGGEDEMSVRKKNVLLRSLIFVNESDVKINDYGEKYIHKKVSLFDYITKTCQFYDSSLRAIPLQPITNEWVNTEGGNEFFANYMENVYPLGIPANCFDTDNYKKYFIGATINKYFSGGGNFDGTFDRNGISPHTPNIHKLSPAFATYTALKVVSSDYNYYIRYLYSPYYVKKTKPLKSFWQQTEYLVLADQSNYLKGRKITYMSAKPRCCVLNNNYETSEKAFIKKYPQADQQIRLYCKSIALLDETFSDELIMNMPIFRMLITRK